MKNLSPRQRRRQKTRQTILETAQALITEKGIDGFSLRELARRIDYSPSSLYEYFESKEAIIRAICDASMAELKAAFEAIPQGLSPTQRLIEMSLAYARFAAEDPDRFFLIFTALPSGRRSLSEPVNPTSPYGTLLDTVQAALDAGEISTDCDHAVETIAFSLWSLMHGRAMLQITFLSSFEVDFDLTHRWAIETFLRGLKCP